MDVWDDSQADGPEADKWKNTPKRDLLGYNEPSKASLLDSDAVRKKRQWRRLLNDNVSPHELWWTRLMAFLKRN